MDRTINAFWMERLQTAGEYGLKDERADREEVARLLKLLDRYKLGDAFRKECASLGIEPTVSTAQNFYYAQEVRRLTMRVGIETPLRVLEIGPGGGLCALYLRRAEIVSSYFLVDLTPMLEVARHTLSSMLPDAASVFRFLVTEQVEQVPDSSIDLILNFNSFMEMDRTVRNYYFDQIYRVGCSGALFYNCNRRQPEMLMQDGTHYDNNPLLYPYRASDRVVEWEPDRLSQDRRTLKPLKSPHRSFAVSRACLINLPEQA